MKCVDYQRHELLCDHPDNQRVNWRTVDGCEAFCCRECWVGIVSKWNDLAHYDTHANGRPQGFAGAVHDLLTGKHGLPHE